MSRVESKLMVFDWGSAETAKAKELIDALPRGAWLELAYGYDHACGYFVQVKPEGADEWAIDYDSLFDGLTGGELLHLFGVLRFPVAPAVAAALCGDLDF